MTTMTLLFYTCECYMNKTCKLNYHWNEHLIVQQSVKQYEQWWEFESKEKQQKWFEYIT